MSDRGRVGDLEIDQDLVQQRRDWRVQRIGWAVMGLILLAACLGLFGHGPLSRATAGDGGGPLQAEYERFCRLQTATTLRLRIQPAAVRDGRARLWLDRDYLNAVSLGAVVPEPERVEVGSDRIMYEFAVDESGEGPAVVSFELEPQRPGLLRGAAGLEDGPSIPLRMWVHP